jgi:uncharacterized protein (DUF697 family)
VTTSLARLDPLAHLAEHRRLIVGRSVAAGLLGAVPIPVLDSWITAVVQRGTIRKLAELNRVDMDEESVRAVAEGIVPPPGIGTLLGNRHIFRAFRRSVRRIVLAVTLIGRAEAVTRSFATATLFDHYCRRLHVGAGLDAAAGKKLRAAMEETMNALRGRLLLRVIQRGLTAAGKVALRAPIELVDLASGGLLKRLIARRAAGEAEAIVEEAVTRATSTGWIGRTTQAVEAQLQIAGAAYLADLVGAFERRVRSS